MSSQIDELVSQIENSFKQLSKAVEHIKSAEKLSVEVIKSSNEVKDGFKNTIETLNKVVKEDFQKIYISLAEKTSKLITKIDELDFKNNLDNISNELKNINELLVDKIESKNFDNDFAKVNSNLDEVKSEIEIAIESKNFDNDFANINDKIMILEQNNNKKIFLLNREMKLIKIFSIISIIILTILIIKIFFG
ncbi:MAG TPA: hypothetical protein PLT79_00930 [Flavobacterium sp.]|nr:hypothetical protein [Flavobacterium sp.]